MSSGTVNGSAYADPLFYVRAPSGLQGGGAQIEGVKMSEHCWEQRGCDEEMGGRCPHQTLCPAECAFARCERPTHVRADIFEVLEYPDVDRNVCRKEECRFCRFFLQHGPKVEQHA